MNISFPKTLALCKEKGIKLYLGPCKIVCTQAGRWILVSPIFGAGYFGSFTNDGKLLTNRSTKPEHLDLLQRVEDHGLEAVAAIGLATGMCCICGRTLTAEDSIAGGIGPICGGKVGFSPSSLM